MLWVGQTSQKGRSRLPILQSVWDKKRKEKKISVKQTMTKSTVLRISAEREKKKDHPLMPFKFNPFPVIL